MKKTGSRRGSGYEAGPGSAVLDAPEEICTPEGELRASRKGPGPRRGSGPAPAGALHRGYGENDTDGPGDEYTAREEAEYVPRRGQTGGRFRSLRKSAAGRVVLGVVVLGAVGAAAAGVAAVRRSMLHNPRFVVGTSDDIQITGAQHLTRDQVLSVFGPDLERNIFRVPLEQRRASVEQLPWVAHATVMRLLPNTLRVQITERTPAAFVRQGTQIGLVDAGGVLLDMPPDTAGDPHYSFPVLTGLSSNEPLKDRAERMQVYEQFMADLESAQEHLTDSVSEVDVSDPEDVKAVIASGGSDILVHFGNEDFLKRYREFQQHLPEWKQAYPRLASADMRYEGQIVLEMQKGAPAADGSVAAPATSADGTKAVADATVVSPAAPRSDTQKSNSKDNSRSFAALRMTNRGGLGMTNQDGPGAKTHAALRMTNHKAADPVAKKGLAERPVAKKPVAWKPVATKASGSSAANQRVFAALAAAHKAALARAAAAKAPRSLRINQAIGVIR